MVRGEIPGPGRARYLEARLPADATPALGSSDPQVSQSCIAQEVATTNLPDLRSGLYDRVGAVREPEIGGSA